MAYQVYPRPSAWARLKIAFHYVLPQLAVTRAAGWFAQKEWGAVSHTAIRLFAKQFDINWSEAKKQKPEDYQSVNEFFIRQLREDARPICEGEQVLSLPADGRVSEGGKIDDNRLLQAKGHFFTLEALLAGDVELAKQFKNGVFLTTYLSPRDYHRVHMPCDGVLRQMIYVPGELFSVNPFLAEHVPDLFARNERVICVFDTQFGTMVQILVGATVTASMSTVWHGVVNPPRLGYVQSWDYPADGENAVRLAKGEEMGAFRLGSTVINLFTENKVELDTRLQAGVATKMGEVLGVAHGFRQPET
ncbi:archaetidylserine decarboxylase [Neisseriaceae bacterium B1]